MLTDSQPGGRLHSRIKALRKELSTALGEQLFTKAYNILDNGLDTEDEEVRMCVCVGVCVWGGLRWWVCVLHMCEFLILIKTFTR